MSVTDIIAEQAAADEQHEADRALLATPVETLVRFGVTADTVEAAYQRTLAYIARPAR